MRTKEQIDRIKSRIENPYSKSDFLSKEDINYLIDIFENSESINDPYTSLIKKNTGPVTLDLSSYIKDKVVSSILLRLKDYIGNFSVTAAFFFKTDYPHVIHNDDTFELPDGVHKAITLPLKLYGNYSSYPKLCFFDQFYFHGPAKFFKGSSNIPTYYNKQMYQYDNVDGLVSNKFPEEDKKYFTHLKTSWLEGLSLHSTLDWVPGSALIFDSTRLHCASDFRTLGITEKLGISIFTKIE
jgi:hypothetical protein